MCAGRIFADGGGWRFALVALMMTIAVSLPAYAESQIFTLFDFQFVDGTVMPELRIAYDTQGSLSPARDNAVVLLHDALVDRHVFDPLVGPGRLFDTNRYFVIAADAIGGGESTSSADGAGQDFPRYTIRDMMAAEHALVTRGLGLSQLRAIVGRSMGAFIGLDWAVEHPELARQLVLLAPSPRSDANYRTIIDLLISAVALDPDWNGGRYERNPLEGLRHAGMSYYPWSVSADYLDGLSDTQRAQESEAAAKHFASWDANALVLRLAACRAHEVGNSASETAAALARVTAPVLLLPSASDRLVSVAGARLLRDALPHPTYTEIPGDRGHTAIAAPPGSPERDFIEQAIRGFLR